MNLVYTFPLWVPGVAYGLAAMFVVAAGVMLAKIRSVPLSLVVLMPAACCGGLIAPTLAADQVVLDDEKLEQTTGLWFSPTVKGFRHESVARIVVSTGVMEQNRRAVGWVVEHKDGHTEIIDPGDLWESHTHEIVPQLRALGIEVVED